MATESIHIELDGRLRDHLQRQVGENGAYKTAGDYVKALIQRDLQSGAEGLAWLHQTLEPAMRADDSEFITVSAEDVIQRNKSR